MVDMARYLKVIGFHADRFKNSTTMAPPQTYQRRRPRLR